MNNGNKQRTLKTFLYYISYAGLGLSIGVFGPSLLRLANNTGTTIAQVSTMFFFHSLGYMLGALIGGRSYDRFAGHPIMSLMLVCMAITLAITPIINVLWLLILMMLILGVAQGALDVGGNALLLWTYGSKVGPYMNGLHLFFGAGAFLAPVLVAQSVSAVDSLNPGLLGNGCIDADPGSRLDVHALALTGRGERRLGKIWRAKQCSAVSHGCGLFDVLHRNGTWYHRLDIHVCHHQQSAR